jgi:Holliday junction resolvasome RuvABC endonuclease subunit
MYLALDISTSCTGYCVFDNNGKLIKSNAIVLTKEKNFFKKVSIVENEIHEVVKEYDITDTVIEESLQSFRPGLSSAKTLFTLSKFNGIVQYICYKLGTNIHSYNVNTARKLAGISVNRKSALKTKDQVLIQVSKIESKLTLPKKILKSGPRKGTEIYENFCYDIADAYVIGVAYFKDKNIF